MGKESDIMSVTNKPKLYVDDNGERIGGSGQKGLKYFRNWSKYFDSYSLELVGRTKK